MEFGTHNRFILSFEQAEFVKEIRVNQGYTWRAVAREFYDKYEEMRPHVRSGNQLDGIDLCDAAMILLGEKVEEDGWN